MKAVAVGLDQFVHSPLLIGGRTVVDQTGLTGKYDFTLTWTTAGQAAEIEQGGGSAAALLFTAIQEQLGLRLVPTKASVEVVIIDHIELPSVN